MGKLSVNVVNQKFYDLSLYPIVLNYLNYHLYDKEFIESILGYKILASAYKRIANYARQSSGDFYVIVKSVG